MDFTCAEICAAEQCTGWEQTANCDPNGARQPTNDRPCEQGIAQGLSGVCVCEADRKVLLTCDHYQGTTCAENCALPYAR